MVFHFPEENLCEDNTLLDLVEFVPCCAADLKQALSELAEYVHKWLNDVISFAQWQYRNQWGSTEVRLLLIENYTQYPAVTTWNIVGSRNFCTPLRGQHWNEMTVLTKGMDISWR